MSLEDNCLANSGQPLTETEFNERESQLNVGNRSESGQNSVNGKVNEISADICELQQPLQSVSAPPRRKLNRMGSMRRSDTSDRTDSSDTYDTQLFRSDQNQINDCLPQTDCLNHQNNVTLVVTDFDDIKPKDSNELDDKCHHLRDSSTQCLSTDVKESYVSFSNKTSDNGLTAIVAIEVMERMRGWRSRWFTSDEAKAARRRRCNRFIYYVKVFLTHLCSTTGLCLLVIAYSCMGAVIFKYLESKNEEKQRNNVLNERFICASDLWNNTLRHNILNPENWTAEAIERIRLFEELVVRAVQEDGYGGVNQEKWTFSGALLYSVTVITTIGYGNVTCKTNWGRIVTMIYALFGIPVMFLCLANLGNLMAETFRFSYKRLCCICFCCCDRVSNKYNEHKKSSLKANEIEMKSCAKNDFTESEKEVKVIYSENDDQKVRSVIALTASTPPTTSVTSSQASSPLKSYASTPIKNDLNQQNSDFVVIQESVVKIDESKDRVPIWLVILLVIGYIMAGAFMFSLWEGWGPIEGAYFCFTTLTTIGFGDLVPGSARYSEDSKEQTKFIMCCAYLIVGLSLLAMSFNLVQEEIVIKSKEIARRMGIIPQQTHECERTSV